MVGRTTWMHKTRTSANVAMLQITSLTHRTTMPAYTTLLRSDWFAALWRATTAPCSPMA